MPPGFSGPERLLERGCQELALVFETREVVQSTDQQHRVCLPFHRLGHRAEHEGIDGGTVLALPSFRLLLPVRCPHLHRIDERLIEETELRPHLLRVIGADEAPLPAQVRNQHFGVPPVAGQRFDHGHAGNDAEELERVLRVAIVVARLHFRGLGGEDHLEAFGGALPRLRHRRRRAGGRLGRLIRGHPGFGGVFFRRVFFGRR